MRPRFESASLATLFATLLAGCVSERTTDSSSESTSDSGPTTTATTGPGGGGCTMMEAEILAASSSHFVLGDYCIELDAIEEGELPPPLPILSFDQCSEMCAGELDESGGVLDTCELTGVDESCMFFDLRCEYTVCQQPGGAIGGRLHEIIRSRGDAVEADSPLGAWLAAMAHDEAASVHAFEALASELAAHGAPDELIRRCKDARADEIRHATTMHRLACEHGHTPRQPQLAPARERSLLEIAIENAVEGCVHETWAALQAHYQSRHARTPELRDTMRMIAEDETRHAQLAWDIDAWLATQLSAEDYAHVDQARREAGSAMHRKLDIPREASLTNHAGLPDRAVALALARGLTAQLWAA